MISVIMPAYSAETTDRFYLSGYLWDIGMRNIDLVDEQEKFDYSCG